MTAGQIGAVATAASVNATVSGQEFHLGNRAEAHAVLAGLDGHRAGAVDRLSINGGG